MSQRRSGPGWFGAPSNRNTVAPSARRADDLPRAHDPAEVGEPEQRLAGVQVDLVGDLLGDLHEEPAVHVHRALRPAGGAARVGDEQRVLGVEARVSNRSGCAASSSSQPTSRPSVHGTSSRPQRATTRRRARRSARAATASSATSFIGTVLPAPREAVGGDQHLRAGVGQARGDGVGAEAARRSAGRRRRASRTRSPRRRPRAPSAGRCRPRRPSPTPSEARPFARRSAISRSSRVGDRAGPSPSSPSQTTASASGVRSAHRSTQLCARFTRAAAEPRRPLDAARGVEHPLVRLEELEVRGRARPRPRTTRCRAVERRDQLVVGRDAVRAHEPRDVRALDVPRRRVSTRSSRPPPLPLRRACPVGCSSEQAYVRPEKQPLSTPEAVPARPPPASALAARVPRGDRRRLGARDARRGRRDGRLLLGARPDPDDPRRRPRSALGDAGGSPRARHRRHLRRRGRATTCCSAATRARASRPRSRSRSAPTRTSAARTARTRSSWSTPSPISSRPSSSRSPATCGWTSRAGRWARSTRPSRAGSTAAARSASPERHEPDRLQINHVLYVDLAGFQGLVDALGGVDMCVPYPMQDPLTGARHPGRVPALRRRHRARVRADAPPALRRGAGLRADRPPAAVPARGDLQAALARGAAAAADARARAPGNLVVDEGLRNPAELVYLAGQLQRREHRRGRLPLGPHGPRRAST